MPYLFHENQTPRSDSTNSVPLEPIFCPQILAPRFFTGDTSLAGEASLMHYDLGALYANWLRTVADQQRADGSIGDYGPDTLGDSRDGHANWQTAFVTIPWMIWQRHGDTGVISRHLEQLDAYMSFHESE